MTFSFVPRSNVASMRGMTLVEMLVALTVTLIMMGAVITVFGFIGEQVTDSRSIIETNDRLRSAAHRLREDLSSVTAEMMPPLRPESGSGYFEIIEGPHSAVIRRRNGNFDPAIGRMITGDFDDALFFTIRSSGEPFRGKYGTTDSYESPTAEVAWYLRNTPGQSATRMQNLCVVPEADADCAGIAAKSATQCRRSMMNYDVSVRERRVMATLFRIRSAI